MKLLVLLLQGLEAGEAEAQAAIQAVQAEKAELEGRLSALEDKIEALETENANLESMKVCHLAAAPHRRCRARDRVAGGCTHHPDAQ